MEEFVGGIWDRLITRAARREFPEAAVKLVDIEKMLGVLFRALGGDAGLRVTVAAEQRHCARRRLLARIAGSSEKSPHAALDHETLRLPAQIALFAQRGVDRASLRTVGEAIGVSHTALRHYFASRDELLVEAYRTHEARAAGEAPAVSESAVGQIIEAAERNRSIPGLVELYATLTTDALQEQHALTREFIRDRFGSLRELLAARIESGQRAGRIPADFDPADAAALVIAASDGLQVQWLLEPGAVDVGRSLTILERLFPLGTGTGTPA